MHRPLIILSVACLFAGCLKHGNDTNSMPDLSAVRANLAFNCVHQADHLPRLDPQADTLFQYARYLQNKAGPKDFNEIARYYRIAAAYGHYKANHNAQLLISQGFADSPDAPKEAVDLATQLVQQGIPGGYYDIGHYLETGYGLKQDTETALRYFRKAADLGNPEAQAYVGKMLAPQEKAPAIARQMRECAANQGLGDAASALGIDLSGDKLYAAAVQAFQKGVEAGNAQAASFLENGFKGPPISEPLYYLALPNDSERSRRYAKIRHFIDANDGHNPTLPDIDKIVPLPPAKLPLWDGTFEWQKEQDAAVPPQEPTNELINQMAKAKHLDPSTGLPLANTTQ